MTNNRQSSFYLFAFVVFTAVAAPTLFTEGMFMDGLWYATIARNMAENKGCFWIPFFTETVFPRFYEHPPLAMGLQSLFFRVFGDHLWVERWYSLLTMMVTGWIMVRIWKTVMAKKYSVMAWLPLILFAVTPLALWSVSNNMLENTMMIFTTLSILFMVKSRRRNRFLYLLLAGVSLYLGFLSKGPVALFPLAFPFWLMVFERKYSFLKFLTDLSVIIISGLIAAGLTFLIDPVSYVSLKAYINRQVVGSLLYEQTVNTRFAIVIDMLSNLLPALIVLMMVFLITARRVTPKKMPVNVIVFIFVGLSGVFPVMVSLKQSSFYIFPVFPIFSLAVAGAMAPNVHILISRIDFRSSVYRTFRVFTLTAFLAVLAWSVYLNGKPGRDGDEISDVRALMHIIPENTIVGIQPAIHRKFSLHGYLYRYGYISVDHLFLARRDYFIALKGAWDEAPEGYIKTGFQGKMYDLFIREE